MADPFRLNGALFMEARIVPAENPPDEKLLPGIFSDIQTRPIRIPFVPDPSFPIQKAARGLARAA